jgi:hypothetical protein
VEVSDADNSSLSEEENGGDRDLRFLQYDFLFICTFLSM